MYLEFEFTVAAPTLGWLYNAQTFGLLYLQAFAERVMKSEQASKEPFKSSIDNFYQTDSITRSSSVMAKCVQARKNMHVDTLSTAEMSSK